MAYCNKKQLEEIERMINDSNLFFVKGDKAYNITQAKEIDLKLCDVDAVTIDARDGSIASLASAIYNFNMNDVK